MRRWVCSFIVILALGCAGSAKAWAQASTLDDGPPPPPGADAPAPPAPSGPSGPSATPPSASAAAPGAAAAEPTEPAWDPLRASKDMEVGAYYLKTGNYDAAVDRFREAAKVQPGLAKPYLLLGRAYEKKKDPKSAVAAYQKYLQLFPKAPDHEEVSKEIARLNSLLSKQTKQQASR